MILSISLARNAVFVEVSGCPCSRGVGEELMRRFAFAGFDVFAAALASTVAMKIDAREPEENNDEARRTWTLKRSCAAGLALTWALENGAVFAAERREEPLADKHGVFGLAGWQADN